MDPLTLATIATSVGASAAQAGGGLLVAKKNRQFAEQQQLRQNAYNKQMWNETNTYNSPKAQMARLEAAGLNPAMIYGDSSSGAAGQAPQQQKAEKAEIQDAYYMPQILETISTMSKAMLATANTKNTQIDTKSKEVDLYVKNKTREDAVNIIKRKYDAEEARAIMAQFDTSLEYLLQGGQGTMNLSSTFPIDRSNRIGSIRYQQSDLRKRLDQAEAQLQEKLKAIGANNATISALVSLLRGAMSKM